MQDDLVPTPSVVTLKSGQPASSVSGVLFVQHGDYRSAYRNFAQGGEETYRDQKKSVDFVASLAHQARTTTIALGKETYLSELAPNLWAGGVRGTPLGRREIAHIFDEAAPSHVILRTPHQGFLREARRRNVWLLPVFADIFRHGGLRTTLRHKMFSHLLLQEKIPCVSNHSLNASRSLTQVLGLPRSRIVPWDWSKVPLGGPPKRAVADPSRPTAFFAGALLESKGVGECLAAIAELRKKGCHLSMRFAGPGDISGWEARARDLGIADGVHFLGVISNQQVRHEMRMHDFVIVPTRHSYAEGLPNTIYEALASRSALIVSDHPSFQGRLEPDREALVFPATDASALAACIMRAARSAELYERLSENSENAHAQLYVGMEWQDLVTAFLDDPQNRTGWVSVNCLKGREGGCEK